MRILTGQFKGKYLSAGQDLSIRPTTNRIKEIIFSIIGDFGSDIWLLDLFSGSGSLGLEALSRGAKGITFVDNSHKSVKILQTNIKNLAISDIRFKIVESDVLSFIKHCGQSYKIILADPPFKFLDIQKMMDEICQFKVLDDNGLMMLHHEIDNPIRKVSHLYQIIKQKRVGRSLISFIVREEKNV